MHPQEYCNKAHTNNIISKQTYDCLYPKNIIDQDGDLNSAPHKNLDKKIELSVCVPIYNEQECILELYKSIKDVLVKHYPTHEIIFVDDGSTDNSFQILKKLAEGDGSVKIIKFYRNFGQTKAMYRGIQFAKAPIIITLDGDMQNDPSDIPRLVNKLNEDNHLVCGWRRKRQDMLLFRRLPSLIANILISHFAGLKIHDFGCTLRAYRADMIKKIRLYGEMHRFIPALVSREGGKVVEMEVKHHPRKKGYSKYGLERVIKVFLDIFLLKFLSGYSTRPMHFFGTLSLLFFISSFGIGGYTMYRRFISEISGTNLLPLVLLVMMLAFLATIFFAIVLDLVIVD